MDKSIWAVLWKSWWKMFLLILFALGTYDQIASYFFPNSNLPTANKILSWWDLKMWLLVLSVGTIIAVLQAYSHRIKNNQILLESNPLIVEAKKHHYNYITNRLQWLCEQFNEELIWTRFRHSDAMPGKEYCNNTEFMKWKVSQEGKATVTFDIENDIEDFKILQKHLDSNIWNKYNELKINLQILIEQATTRQDDSFGTSPNNANRLLGELHYLLREAISVGVYSGKCSVCPTEYITRPVGIKEQRAK